MILTDGCCAWIYSIVELDDLVSSGNILDYGLGLRTDSEISLPSGLIFWVPFGVKHWTFPTQSRPVSVRTLVGRSTEWPYYL